MSSDIDELEEVFGHRKLKQGMMTSSQEPSQAPSTPPFLICPNQTFAFCGLSSCYVYNNVAYCNCLVEMQDSISLSLVTVDGQDVCEINAMGVTNSSGSANYMISTFYNDPNASPPNGDMAIYTCERGQPAAYAQCDGAFCFEGSQMSFFPGFDTLQENEIICSCPITYSDGTIPFQVGGMFDNTAMDGCQSSVFESFCNSTGMSQPLIEGAPQLQLQNGLTSIAVGAPIGGAVGLGAILAESQGMDPPVTNQCRKESKKDKKEKKDKKDKKEKKNSRLLGHQ